MIPRTRKVLELVHDLLADYHAGKRRRRKRPSLVVVPIPGKDRQH
jgi:hypothetical protein